MSGDPLQSVREALKAGDKKTAQELLRPQLQYQPTAEMWYLAAQACATDDKAIQCLRRALVLQPQHSGANRMLHRLEGAVPKAGALPVQPPSARAAALLIPEDEPLLVSALPRSKAEERPAKLESAELEALAKTPLKKVKRGKKRSPARTLVLISVLLLGSVCSMITMNLAGIITGPITVITRLTGGGEPITQIDGKPIGEISDAPLEIPASMTKPLKDNRDASVLEPGYVHEYTFNAHDGDEMAVYIQFLSLAANKVSRNVVMLRPDDSDATSICESNAILQGDNNITLICPIDATGIWKVRLLGRDHESVGAYFVGVEQMDG